MPQIIDQDKHHMRFLCRPKRRNALYDEEAQGECSKDVDLIHLPCEREVGVFDGMRACELASLRCEPAKQTLQWKMRVAIATCKTEETTDDFFFEQRRKMSQGGGYGGAGGGGGYGGGGYGGGGGGGGGMGGMGAQPDPQLLTAVQ